MVLAVGRTVDCSLAKLRMRLMRGSYTRSDSLARGKGASQFFSRASKHQQQNEMCSLLDFTLVNSLNQERFIRTKLYVEKFKFTIWGSPFETRNLEPTLALTIWIHHLGLTIDTH